MVAELISVGTELLMGNIVNTNARFLSRQCADLGLTLYYQTVVGDNEERLKETLERALSRADVIFLTGGLGPTRDDLTKETVAKTLHKSLIESKEIRAKLETYFQRFGRSITENNWKQALVIEGAKILENTNGTAPGLLVESEGNKRIFLLPGPPGEMMPMFEQSVMPILLSLQNGVLYSEMVKLCGIGESQAETMILDLIDQQTNPTIAPYAKPGEVHFRVTAKAATKEEGKALVEPMIAELKNRFGTHIFTCKEEETLEAHVLSLLRERKCKLSLAESCTGGLLAARLTAVPNASSVIEETYVVYSEESKKRLLLVSEETVQNYSVVSEETAAQMAQGAAKLAKADVAISITGLAGPSGFPEEGATEAEKKVAVGTVAFGCYFFGKIKTEQRIFQGEREKVRAYAVQYALDFLRRCLQLP